MPTPVAVFDADGVCVAVAAHPGRQPANGAKAEVEPGTRPQDVWWDGQAVQASEPADLAVPATLPLGEAWSVELPANTVADVNGARQRGTLTLPTDKARRLRIELRGAQYGSFACEVQDYAAARKAEYPSLADQLDALWKGGSAASGMKRRIANVKATHPKPE